MKHVNKLAHKILLGLVVFGFSLIVLVIVIRGNGQNVEVDEIPSTEKTIESLSWFFDSSTTFSECNYNSLDFKRIITSAVRVLEFFEKHFHEVQVIDGVVGIRVLECFIRSYLLVYLNEKRRSDVIFSAQLKLFQLEHPKLPQSVKVLFSSLQLRAKRLSESTIEKLSSTNMTATQRKQFEHDLSWVNDATVWEAPDVGCWKPDGDLIPPVNVTLKSLLARIIQLNEELSDKCTTDILLECDVSNKCSKYFMVETGSLYVLTHQIFFFFFAKKKNCFNEERFQLKMADKSPDKFIHSMCEKTLEEANAIEKGNFPNNVRDLLAEQIMVCSLLGYSQFLKIYWLHEILSWQSESGCYVLHLENDITNQEVNHNQRIKRADNRIMDGENCSVHYSTVALGAIAMHLRYFGDTCLRNY